MAPDAEEPAAPDHLDGADLILVMERAHRARLQRRFGRWLKGKRVVFLDIPDDYAFMQPELVALLEQRASRFFLLPLREKVAAEGRRMRGRTGAEGSAGETGPRAQPSSDLASLGHLLPQGEKGRGRFASVG